MQTVEAPASIRDQALAVIRSHLTPSLQLPKTQLWEAGTEILTDVLIDLERTFGIDLDVHEVWPAATLSDVATLVVIKTCDAARRDLLPANDDMPMIDRAKLRARRARSGPVYLPPAELLPLLKPARLRDSRTLRLVGKLMAIGAMAGGACGLIVGCAEMGQRWGWL